MDRAKSANPIIAPGKGTWDANACYKPFAIFDKQTNRWLLWYNGRRKRSEQIGLASHEGDDLGWGQSHLKMKTTRSQTQESFKTLMD